MVIEHAVGRTHDRLAVSSGIPSHADARLDVIPVGLNSFLQSQHVVSGKSKPLGRFEFRGDFHVVANAIVQSDVRTDAPRVLPEGANGNVLEGIAGTAEALYEIYGQSGAVRLHGREVGDRQAGN